MSECVCVCVIMTFFAGQWSKRSLRRERRDSKCEAMNDGCDVLPSSRPRRVPSSNWGHPQNWPPPPGQPNVQTEASAVISQRKRLQGFVHNKQVNYGIPQGKFEKDLVRPRGPRTKPSWAKYATDLNFSPKKLWVKVIVFLKQITILLYYYTILLYW